MRVSQGFIMSNYLLNEMMLRLLSNSDIFNIHSTDLQEWLNLETKTFPNCCYLTSFTFMIFSLLMGGKLLYYEKDSCL